MANAQGTSKIDSPNVGGTNATVAGDADGKPATFHDFLGNKGHQQESAPPLRSGGGRPLPEVSPSATSDLGSERLAGNHLEGMAYFGSRGDFTGRESSNRFTGSKRSNSDSFIMSPREKFPQGQSDSQDGPLLTKLLRYSGGEHPRRPPDEDGSFGMHQMRPMSASFMPQSSTAGRTDTNPSKWDQAAPLKPSQMLQYPPRTGQVIPLGYQATSNRFKDTNVGPSLVSQTAADEGSRTGIKGSGILSSINAGGAMAGRQPAGVLIRSGKQKSGVGASDLETSAAPSHRGTEPNGRQMTIFYGGQAHVFDNVHPNKADVIMALAGSNGGSWSTTYNKPNSSARPSPTGDNRRTADNVRAGMSILRELQGKPSSADKGDTHRGFGSASGD